MRKFLGVGLAVGALAIAGAAVAQLDPGSEHDIHGAKEPMSKAGHHEMMKNQMSNAGHDMKTQMGKSGHDTSHAGKVGHDMKNHTGKAGHE